MRLSDWRNALLVPVPKKGDSSFCDNWRGISLLDVMGKLYGRVLNDRLQLVVEETVADSQCRFRAGRDCVDIVFCVCQLVEVAKAIDHNYARLMILCPMERFDAICRSTMYLIL